MMTIWQAVSICTFGVVGFALFCNLIFAIRFDKQPFGLFQEYILAICAAELLIVFLGVRV